MEEHDEQHITPTNFPELHIPDGMATDIPPTTIEPSWEFIDGKQSTHLHENLHGHYEPRAGVETTVGHNRPGADSAVTGLDNDIRLTRNGLRGHESTECLEQGALLRDLGAVATKFSSQHQKFKVSREGALLLRNHVDYKRDEYHKKREFVFQSLQEIVKSFEKVDDNADFNFKMSVLQSQLPVLREDNSALDQHAEEIRKLEETLSTTESLMQEREKALFLASEETVSVLDKLGMVIEEVKTAPNSVPGPPSQRPQSPDYHPLLQDYYDKAGQVKVMHGRLIKFDSEHRENVVQRKFDQDQDKTLNQTDEEFEASYERERMQRQSWLQHAIEAAEAARSACIAEELNVDVWKEGREDYGDEDAQSSYGAAGQGSSIMSAAPEELKVAYARRDVFPSEEAEIWSPMHRSFHEVMPSQELYVIAPSDNGPFVTTIPSDAQQNYDQDSQEHNRQRVERWITQTGTEVAPQLSGTVDSQRLDSSTHQEAQAMFSHDPQYDVIPSINPSQLEHELSLAMRDLHHHRPRRSKSKRSSGDAPQEKQLN